jgi:hypothetical protein
MVMFLDKKAKHQNCGNLTIMNVFSSPTFSIHQFNLIMELLLKSCGTNF